MKKYSTKIIDGVSVNSLHFNSLKFYAMVDTIILRVHDLQKNAYLIQCLEFNNNNGYTTSMGRVPKSEIAKVRSEGVTSESELLDVLQSKRTGDFILKTQMGKHMNASNHYAFTFYINYTKDFIEFNFSIPKYKFGTNILMFVEHIGDKDFRYHDCQTLEHNIERAYKLLSDFLKYFLKMEFILNKVDLRDVEVHRIDVCFNQFFNSKEDALLYLDYQKKLKKKYARDEDGVMRDYTTSLMYVTKSYSAKIYHKGSEYEKNDLKEHQKMNEEKGFDYFKTDRFQSFSDKILRYELTIRNGLINYLHKHNVFRKDCRWFRMEYKNYLKVENGIQRNDRISKRIGSLPPEEKEEYRLKHPYEKISKDSMNGYKSMTKLLTSRRSFMLEVDIDSLIYNKETVNFLSDKVLFSESVFKLCLKKLFEFIKDFQIEELPAEESLKRIIDDYNKRNRNQLPVTEMCHFYTHLMSRGSFKEAGKFTMFSRATLFRYKQRFKQIGITDKHLKPMDKVFGIPKTNIDLREYHSTILYDNNLLRGININ